MDGKRLGKKEHGDKRKIENREIERKDLLTDCGFNKPGLKSSL